MGYGFYTLPLCTLKTNFFFSTEYFCVAGDDTTSCHNYQNYFRNEELGIGNDLAIMLVAFVVYFAILIFMKSELHEKIMHVLKYPCSINIFKTHYKKSEKDEDFTEDTSLQVTNLTKTFFYRFRPPEVSFGLIS